jgi:DNA-binding FadR family transcriptional regulator
MTQRPSVPVARVVRKRVVEHAADELRSAILSDRFVVDGYLPPERDLATALGVSRLTLRAALSRLESEGLVRAVHGRGTQVLDYRRSAGLDLLDSLMRLQQGVDEVPPPLLADLLEVRRLLAGDIMALAAERHTAEDLAAIRAEIDRLQSLVGNPQPNLGADLELTRLILRAARNVALDLICNGIERFLLANPVVLAAWYANPAENLAIYEAMYSRLAARDARGVREVTAQTWADLDASLMARLGMAPAPTPLPDRKPVATRRSRRKSKGRQAKGTRSSGVGDAR